MKGRLGPTWNDEMADDSQLAKIQASGRQTFRDRTRNYAQEERPFSGASELIVEGAIDVYWFRADTPRLVVAAELREDLAKVVTRVSGDTLRIEGQGGSINIAGFGNVVAGRDVWINGGRVVTDDSTTGRVAVGLASPSAPVVTIRGSGDVYLSDMDQADLRLSVQGSGTITATGRVLKLMASVSGSGDVHADGLEVSQARLAVFGSGDISAYARVSVDAEVQGSGDIVIRGNPADRTEQIAGSGRVAYR